MPPSEDRSATPEHPDLRHLIRAATTILTEAQVPSAEADAITLAEYVLGIDRLVLVMPPPLPEEFTADYAAVVERRRRREPLQHITGRAHFRHLVLQVRPGVFIPRPETEVVAEHAVSAAHAVRRAGRDPLVADLCCGAGPIAVSVASEVPGSSVLAVDAEGAAVDLTLANAAAARVRIRAMVADVRQEDLLAEHEGQVDVLVANPPYIPPDAVPQQREVREHDPDLALYGGGPDGLDIPRAVIRAAARLLRPSGVFIMEHAEVQAGAVRDVVSDTGGFTEVATAEDLSGRARMVLARRR